MSSKRDNDHLSVEGDCESEQQTINLRSVLDEFFLRLGFTPEEIANFRSPSSESTGVQNVLSCLSSINAVQDSIQASSSTGSKEVYCIELVIVR